jgi:heat shock protein HtpX
MSTNRGSGSPAGSKRGPGPGGRGAPHRNRRPPQQRASQPAPAPAPVVHQKIDPWAPVPTGTWRAVVARLAPLFVVVVGVVVAAVGVVAVGIVLVVIGGLIAIVNEWVGGAERVIARVGGRSLAAGDEPGLRNIVEGLCVASGQAVPEIRLLDDEAPNALLLGRRAGPAVLVCTTGLLTILKRIELEGVVAHELAHLKSGDTRRAAHAMAACGALALVSGAAPRAILWLGDPRREALADLAGSAMTRFPPGLRAALGAIARTPLTIRAIDRTAVRLTAPLWCAPLGGDQARRTRPGVLDLELRVEALAEL